MKVNKTKITNKVSYIAFVFILAFLLVFLSGCTQNTLDENTMLKSKLREEVSYLDYSILNIMNRLNNIQETRYSLVTEEVQSKNGDQQETKAKADTTESESAASSTNNSETKNKVSRLEKSSILNGVDDAAINWTDLQYSIETMYTAWPTIEADLRKVNIGDNEILAFQDNFNLAMQGLKNQDRNNTMIGLNNLYLQIPAYISNVSNDPYLTALYYIKSNILSAYTYVTMNSWQEAQNSILTADQNYVGIINNANYMNGNNAHNIQKGYMLLKDLESSISLNDKEIFFLKYKYLIEQINGLIG